VHVNTSDLCQQPFSPDQREWTVGYDDLRSRVRQARSAMLLFPLCQIYGLVVPGIKDKVVWQKVVNGEDLLDDAYTEYSAYISSGESGLSLISL